jgi:hypothetical protein
MILTTPDGKEIKLLEDNIWQPVGNRELIIEKDFTVKITDGRIVLINADGTWGFVDSEVQYAEDMLVVDKVVGKGHAKNVDVTMATNAATKQALDNAVEKTRNAIRKIKVTSKKVRECVERVEKDIDTQESFYQGQGWVVDVLITLDKGSLIAVVDCAREPPAAPAPVPAPSSEPAPDPAPPEQ